MKKFFRKLMLAALPALAVIMSIELLYRFAPNDYLIKKNMLSALGTSAQILILGNSHAYHGLNPQRFSLKCFNAAMVSQSYKYDRLIFEKNKSGLSNLQWIILPASIVSFNSELDYSVESWRRDYYKMYYGNKSDQLTFSFLFDIGVIPVAQRCYQHYVLHKDNLCDAQGFNFDFVSSDSAGMQKDAITSVRRHSTKVCKSEIPYENISVIIDEAEKMHCKVLLITLPTTVFYRNAISDTTQSAMLNQVAKLKEEHRNLYYINYTDSPYFGLSDFHDADHLNVAGANKISSMVNDTLLRLDKKI